MIYGNYLISQGKIKLPVLPTGYAWDIFSSPDGQAWIRLLLNSQVTEFIAPIPMPQFCDDEEQKKIITRAAASVKWDLATAILNEMPEEDYSPEPEGVVLNAVKRFSK